MSGLLDSLSTSARALDAQRMGLDVAGQNLANLNTVGYSRRSLLLAELPATDNRNAGRGVEVVRVSAARDLYIEARLRQEQEGSSRDAAVVDALSVVEAAVGRPGQSLDAAMSAFFDGFSTLAENVTSVNSRDAVVLEGQQLVTAFHQMADRLTSARNEADTSVRGTIDEVNTLANRVSLLNNKIATANGADVQSLIDERGAALGSLSKLANVVVTSRSDGGVDVSIGHGRPIVMGGDAYALATGAAPVSGIATIEAGGVDITSEVTGGKLGGLLEVRDVRIPDYGGRLDQLAFELTTAVNARHRAGFDANGTAGQDFFVVPAAAPGSSSQINMNPAIVADSQLVAASSTGLSGDNQTARALARLRDDRVFNGGTSSVSDLWSTLVYRVGADSARATSSRDTRQLVVDQLQRLRDGVSGVSTDEEAAWLMKFQRAYEANARYFATISGVLDSLMGMVR